MKLNILCNYYLMIIYVTDILCKHVLKYTWSRKDMGIEIGKEFIN